VSISRNCRRYVQSYYIGLMTNRKLHMHFRLTPRSVTLDDLGLYKFEFSDFLGISHISDATTAKRMNIDQYCQRQRSKHVQLEQFLTCVRVARVCQRQLSFLVFWRHWTTDDDSLHYSAHGRWSSWSVLSPIAIDECRCLLQRTCHRRAAWKTVWTLFPN